MMAGVIIFTIFVCRFDYNGGLHQYNANTAIKIV